MTDIVRLKGEKIDLCILRTDEEAIEYYTKWMNDEETLHWIGRNHLICQYFDEEEWVEKKRPSNEHMFLIVEKESRRMLGTCGCDMIPNSRNAQVGICIGEHDGRNKGYGTEAMKLMVRYAFDELNAHTVQLTANGDNARALACYKKAGFTECGRLHEAKYYNGHYADTVYMEILEKDWEKLKENY